MADENKIVTLFETKGLKSLINQVEILIEIYRKVGTVAPSNINKILRSVDSVSSKLNISTASVKKFLAEFYKATAGIHGNKIRFLIETELSNRSKRLQEKLHKVQTVPVLFDIKKPFDPKDIMKTRPTLSQFSTKSQKGQLLIYNKLKTLIIGQIQANKKLLATDEERVQKIRFLEDAFHQMDMLIRRTANFKYDFVTKKEIEDSKQYMQVLKSINTSISHQSKKQEELARETKKASTEQKQLNQRIGVAIGKLVRYRVAFFLMRGAMDATKKSVKDFADVQFLLADLQKVIDANVDSIKRYRIEAFRLSRTFGSNINDIIKSMKVWAQTGMDQNAVLKATQATLIGVNALGSTAQEVTEALTSAIFTYGVSASNVTEIISKWLLVQKNFPITAQDLANSLKAVGAAAKVVGVDLNDLAGYVAAIGASTRKSGSAIGQSLKTMFARLPRKKVISVFENIGIAVLKNANQLRDLDNVLEDLHKKWGNLSSVEKANIAVTFGGIRRYADFIALMDNFNIKTAATIKAQQASTEAMDANQLTLNTFKKAWEQTIATLSQFGVIVGQSLAGPLSILMKIAKGLLWVLNSLHGMFGKLAAATAAFLSVLTVGSIVLLGFKFLVERARDKIREYSIAARTGKMATIGFAAAEEEATVASGGFVLALRNIQLAIGGISALFMAVTLVLSLVSAGMTFFSSSQNAASNAIIKGNQSLKDSIKTTQERIKSLKKEQNLTKEVINNIIDYKEALDKLPVGNTKRGELLKKLGTQISLLPPKMYDLVKAGGDVANSDHLLVKSKQDLIEANQKYDESNQEQIKHLEKLNDLQIKQLIKVTETEKASLQNRKETIDKFYKYIEGNIKTVKPAPFNWNDMLGGGYSPHINSSKFIASILKNFNFKFIQKTLNEKFKIAMNPAAQGFELQKSLNVFFQELGKEYQDGSKRLAKKAEKFGIAKEVANKLIITDKDKQHIINSFKNLFTSVQVGIERANNIPVETTASQFFKILSKNADMKKSFFSIFNQQLKTNIDELNNNLGLLTKIGQAIDEINKAISSKNKTLNDVRNKNKSNNQTFEIGTKPSNDVINFSKSLDSLTKHFQTITEQFNVFKKSLKFGKVIDPSAFKADAMFKFVKEVGAKFQDLGYQVSHYTDKLKYLREIQKRLAGKINPDTKEYNGLTKMVDLLADIPAEFKAIALGSEKPAMDVNQAITETTNNLKDLKRQIKQVNLSGQWQKAVQYINEYNKQAKDNVILQNQINAQYDNSIKALEFQLKYLAKFPNKDKEIIALEKEKTQLIIEQSKALSQSFNNFPLLSQEEKYKAVLKAVNTEHKERISLLNREFKIRIDKVMENSVNNAKIFKNTIQDAFTNLPDNILQNSQKRKDLTYEIKKAELDLQDARSSGDAQAVKDAKNRLALVKDEMKEYRRGWKEVKTIITDVMNSIGTAFYKNLVEQFAENLSNIPIKKDKDLGKYIGDAITNSTNNFINGYSNAMKGLYNSYYAKLKLINNDYQRELTNIYNTYFVNLSNINNTFIENLKSIFNNITQSLQNPKTKTTNVINKANYINHVQGIQPQEIDVSSLESVLEKSLTTQNSILLATKENNPVNNPEIKKNTQELNSLQRNIKSLSSMISYTLAASLVGTKNEGAKAGVGFGEAIGQSAFTQLFKTPSTLMSIFGGPMFGLAGGILGGILGGLFGNRPKMEEPLTKAMDSNTNATISNTLALKEIDKKIFNAPTRFNVPTGNYGYGNAPITIHISSTNDAHIAETIKEVLSGDYDIQIQNSGSRGFVPV